MSHDAFAAREKEIFMSARDLPDAAERTRYLDEACTGDPALRRRVEVLLRTEANAGKFLEPAGMPGDSIGYFGDYLLLEEIARGSSGVVFRARQTSLDRVVALKMLRDPLLMNDADVQRFRAEAKAAAALDHPGIVPIYEVGEHAGQGYFSMKLIEGGTLQVRAGEFREPRTAAALIARVARAVHHAHERGILHRDLKPGNILIDRSGAPLVVDFGTARKMGLEGTLTQHGQIIGTPHYMAPEQARGENRGLTAAADIYSLGAILYELLAGKRLFDGETMLTLLRQVTEQRPPPLRIGDRDLEAIVMRSLEKVPAARHASADAFADELERWLRGEPPTKGAALWSRRRFAYAALGGIGAAAAAAFFWKKESDEPARGSYAAARKAAEWLRRIPKNSGESYISVSLGNGNLPAIKDAEPLPTGDWHLTDIWLDRLNAPGPFPPLDHVAFSRNMGGLTRLRSIFIRQFSLPDEAYSFLAHNPDLEKLIIEGGSAGDDVLTHLRNLQRLRVLKLDNVAESAARLTGRGFAQLNSLRTLEFVALPHSHIDDSITETLKHCPKLQAVNLSDTPITDAGVRVLTTIPTLTSLNLDYCDWVTDVSLAALAGMSTLQSLSVLAARISKAGAESFMKARPGCEFFHNAA